MVYASKTVTVYGGAYETITIEGYYGASFTTNSNGSVSHVVPIDTIILTGSVSGQSFERTVTNDTTEVYAMTEGALYWYGWNSEKWNLAYTNMNSVYYSFSELVESSKYTKMYANVIDYSNVTNGGKIGVKNKGICIA